jgi:selenocysteine lyase/cysteine desulfurase
MTIEAFFERFSEEPGYLDHARRSPIGRAAREEEASLSSLFGRARFGILDTLDEQDARVRAAVADLTGFRDDQVVFQPNTSQGLMHAMFGLTGEVLLSPSEFPSNTYAVSRAADALGVVSPRWLETDHGRVTPGNIKRQLSASTVAVQVSLVDYRTGYLLDLEGIREVIGDRLLIVDAIQGFGIVDAPYHLADVVVSGGQKWVRAGWGTGFLALSDRAVDALVPVFSGFSATDADGTPTEVLPPTRGARAFSVSNPDPVAQGRLAAALEEIAEVGIPTINALLAEKVTRLIDLADEFGIEVSSPRAESERAGIVVVTPEPDQLTLLTASLHNHGVTSTSREGSVRLSPHVTTDEETFTMLRAAFTSYASAVVL